MSNFVQPFDDDDNPLSWLGKIVLAVTVGAVLSQLGVPRLPDNIRF